MKLNAFQRAAVARNRAASPKIVISGERTCRRKRAYEQYYDAAVSMGELMKRVPDDHARRLTVYRCNVCGKWHVGKKRAEDVS